MKRLNVYYFVPINDHVFVIFSILDAQVGQQGSAAVQEGIKKGHQMGKMVTYNLYQDSSDWLKVSPKKFVVVPFLFFCLF